MSATGTRIGVIGFEHPHIFEIVQRLVDAGGAMVAHDPTGILSAPYAAWQSESQAMPWREIIADETIDVIVTAAIPCDRAEISIEAIRAGKYVLSDKPGVTTLEDLSKLKQELKEKPGRRWTVLFTERFENRAIREAIRLVQLGLIGSVVAVEGVGGHSLYPDVRPAWFWDSNSTGGILVDIGSHQADQFLSVLPPHAKVSVSTSFTGNVSCQEHLGMEDIGSMILDAGSAIGHHRVDYLTPAGLGVWGDVRLVVVGTKGTIEVRANIDISGTEGKEHLFLIDAEGIHKKDVSTLKVTWAEEFLADVKDDGDRLMTQDHVIAVCDLTLTAQSQAKSWAM